MKERRIEVDDVVVTAPSLAQVDHAVVTEVSHHAPNGALRQIEISRDLLDGRVGTNSHVEEYASLRGEKGPISPLALAVGCPAAGLTLFGRGWLADRLMDHHDLFRLSLNMFLRRRSTRI